jgi:hypothetical protein
VRVYSILSDAQVKKFADAHPKWRDGPSNSGLAGAGYLVVASERLVNPNEAIIPLREMAEFVGSPLTDAEVQTMSCTML